MRLEQSIAHECGARFRYITTAHGEAVIFIREPRPGHIIDLTVMLSDLAQLKPTPIDFIKTKLKVHA